MTEERHRPARPSRSEPREVSELRQLRTTNPELATAIDLQVALLQLQHRVRGRLPVVWQDMDPEWMRVQQERGHPLLRFEDIQLDWTEFRLMFRQTADVLFRFEAMDRAEYARVQALARNGHALDPLIVRWYNATAAPERLADAPAGRASGDAGAPPVDVSPDTLEQVVLLAMRPFLERSAEVLLQRADFSAWSQPYCPLCGGEPELALITVAAERLLICSRCTARWRYHPLACPFCRNDDRAHITSFASRDGRYRIYACNVCRRYLKAYDGRQGGRPVMLAVDSIATLPLDAAAMQKGYRA